MVGSKSQWEGEVRGERGAEKGVSWEEEGFPGVMLEHGCEGQVGFFQAVRGVERAS